MQTTESLKSRDIERKFDVLIDDMQSLAVTVNGLGEDAALHVCEMMFDTQIRMKRLSLLLENNGDK